jgi:hypothetical protein
MKMMLFCSSNVRASVILALFWSFALGAASANDAPAKRAKNPLALPRVPDVAIPQSVFNIPNQPSEGRNPFFPQSTIKVAPPTKLNPENPLDTTSIVLNGITSPPKRTAMINGRTFEPGEEGEVRLPAGGKMLIKVEEIKSESAIILVGGQRRELRLRAGV